MAQWIEVLAMQAWEPEFNPRDPHDAEGEDWPLKVISWPPHMHQDVHIYTHIPRTHMRWGKDYQALKKAKWDISEPLQGQLQNIYLLHSYRMPRVVRNRRYEDKTHNPCS